MPAGRLHVPASNDAVDITSLWRRHGWGGGGCPAFAGWPEGRPWSCSPPGGGQLWGGICVSFPGVCCILASGLHWWFCIFSAASCPRWICRNPHSVCGLFWILLHVPACTIQSWIIFINMCKLGGVCTYLVQILVLLLLGVVAAACVCDPDNQVAILEQARAWAE